MEMDKILGALFRQHDLACQCCPPEEGLKHLTQLRYFHIPD